MKVSNRRKWILSKVLLVAFIRSVGAVLVFATVSTASARADDAIKVLVYNYARVPPGVLKVAEGEARRLFGTAGSQLEWVSCAPVLSNQRFCDRGWSKELPGLTFITGFDKYKLTELGHANVPVLATIYYERVVLRVQEENAESGMGKILGALIAHELCHLLLQVTGHSETGLMVPVWGSSQLQAARLGRLTFTREQLIRINNRLAERALNSRDAAGTTQLPSTHVPGN